MDVTETPTETLETATERDTLPLEILTLIGTFVRPDSSDALIRRGNGRIERVRMGDRLGWRRVAAIEPGALILTRNGDTHRLSIPDPANG